MFYFQKQNICTYLVLVCSLIFKLTLNNISNKLDRVQNVKNWEINFMLALYSSFHTVDYTYVAIKIIKIIPRNLFH